MDKTIIDSYYFLSVGQEIRDRFSGAVEAFARRNALGSGYHGEHSRNRASEDLSFSAKETVSRTKLVNCF